MSQCKSTVGVEVLKWSAKDRGALVLVSQSRALGGNVWFCTRNFMRRASGEGGCQHAYYLASSAGGLEEEEVRC